MEGDLVAALAGVMPEALRERLWEATFLVLTQAIENDPQLAPTAYLHRGLMALARGDRDAGVADLRAAVASEDGTAVYWAAWHLIQLHKAFTPYLPYSPQARAREEYVRESFFAAANRAEEMAGQQGQGSSNFYRQMRDWAMKSENLLFQPSPYALLAWLHSRPTHKSALPVLEFFYAAAVELGYCAQNPMPQVKQLLGLAPSSAPVPHLPAQPPPLQDYSHHIS